MTEVFGISPRAIGMANAFSAIAEDFSACYYNPAGLAQHEHHAFTIGYVFAQPRLKQYLSTDPNVINETEQVNFRGLVFGMVVDLTKIFNIGDRNLALGVATSAGDNFLAGWRAHDWDPEVPRFIRYGDVTNRVHLYCGVGFEVFKEIAYIGIGFNFWQDIAVPDMKLKMHLVSQEVLEKEIDIDADAQISPIIGFLLKPFPWLSIAYTYRDQWSQEIPADLTAVTKLGPIELPIHTEFASRDYFLPWNMTVGVAGRPDERLLVSLDVTYYHWAAFELPMWEGEFPEWNNTVVPRLGVEYKVWKELLLRAGYWYEASPVPDQSDMSSNHLDFDKHVVSTGLGYTFSKVPYLGELPFMHAISVDFFFQWQIMEKRTQAKVTGQPGWLIEGYQVAAGFGVSSGF